MHMAVGRPDHVLQSVVVLTHHPLLSLSFAREMKRDLRLRARSFECASVK